MARRNEVLSMKAMELKVWVDGVQRIVCGVTEFTTCQEVVIALAQAIGKVATNSCLLSSICISLKNPQNRKKKPWKSGSSGEKAQRKRSEWNFVRRKSMNPSAACQNLQEKMNCSKMKSDLRA